ncbi:isovaleryl-CoA dehydrogenase, mitochondrial-like [Xenopus laevis]|uniref:Isovaleryl-CoA dehydrogenase, mitochondrial-like n=1 Tax=Xenopus laevis TaxID=8355 RepID=A0A8J1LIC1_XENLA|nr:isovaleryl-CoA dehydrogenase, mitochondrial-like [Xenopus laevis]
MFIMWQRPATKDMPIQRTVPGDSVYSRVGYSGGSRWYPVFGGNGYINDYPMGRFLRDAKLYEIGAGTSEIQRMVISRAFNALYK